MNDRDLDRLVARANPFGDDAVKELPTGGAESDLLEEIVRTVPIRRMNMRLIVAAAAAVMLVALGGIFLPGGGGPASPPPAYAAEVVAVAEANQRLLVDSPDWRVTNVPEFTVTTGEMIFSNGRAELSVHWRKASEHRSFADDRAASASSTKKVELLGQTGTRYRYGDSARYTTILAPKGPNFLEIDGNLGSEKAYQDLVAKLHPVDVNTWLAAMPESVVKPADAQKAITEMLSDIPVPAGFDPRSVNDQATRDRYQLGAMVTGAVTCAWFDQWTKAKKQGDAKRVQEAVTALGTSRSWKVLHEMNSEGDWPEVLWELTGKVGNGQDPTGYKEALGCK